MAEYAQVKAPEKRGYRKLHHLEIEPIKGANGGHMVTHHYQSEGMSYHEPQKHVFAKGDGEALMAHVGKAIGVKMAEAEPKEEAQEQEA